MYVKWDTGMIDHESLLWLQSNYTPCIHLGSRSAHVSSIDRELKYGDIANTGHLIEFDLNVSGVVLILVSRLPNIDKFSSERWCMSMSRKCQSRYFSSGQFTPIDWVEKTMLFQRINQVALLVFCWADVWLNRCDHLRKYQDMAVPSVIYGCGYPQAH